MKKGNFLALGLSFLPAMTVFAGSADATLIFSNDFDAPAYIAAGVTASLGGSGAISSATGTYSAPDGKSWSGQYYNANGASATLTLSNLPAHTGVSIDMLLGFLNSWDSSNGSVAPDYLDISIDGNLLLNMTTNNATGSVVDFDGGTPLVDNGQIDGSQFYSDDLVDMGTAPALSFAHTASTLTVVIAPSGGGWQGWTDEGWGMDALSVTLRGDNPIPEPSTMLLFGSGFAALAGCSRLRRKK